MGRQVDLGREAEALRGLVQEAHGVLGDLRRATKEARELAPGVVKERLNAALDEGIEEYREFLVKVVAAAERRVTAEFDKVADLLMGRTAEDRAEGEHDLGELVAELVRPAETITDARELGGDIVGPGGPHDRGVNTFDTERAVILDGFDVAVSHDGSDDGAVTLLLLGRVNGTKDHAKVLYILEGVGAAAAMVTELEALMRRAARDGWWERYVRAKAVREARLRADGSWE